MNRSCAAFAAAVPSFPGKPTSPACRRAFGCALIASLAALTGCVLTPEGTSKERDRAARDGASYEPRFETRTLPELPAEPTWREVLSRAFLASGELEAAYFQWKASLERIDIAGSWPNSDVNLGFDYMFSSGSMKAFDRTTVTAGFDSMENLSFPTKTAQAAKVALDEARAMGERFRAVKFDVQKRVLFAWADFVQQGREIDIRRQELSLRRMLVEVGAIGAATGAGQQGLVEADVARRLAQSDLDDMLAEHAGMRAMINAWLHREPEAPLGLPGEPEKPRAIPATDAELMSLAAETFPEVAVFAMEVQGRRDALELARMRWIPDISPTFSFTGSVSQAIGAMITLPTTVAEIRAGIREAEAELRSAEAMLRQRKVERVGEYVGLLVTLRRSQDKAKLFREVIEPATRRLVEARMRAYEAGSSEFRDVIEGRQLLLDTRVVIARAEATVEKSVVDIECCLGLDIETLGKKKEQSHE